MTEKEKIINDEEKSPEINEPCNGDENCACDDSCCCDDHCACHEHEANDEGSHCVSDDEDQKKEFKLRHKSKDNKKEVAINALKEQVKDLENKNLLATAELINYRKRKDDEVSRMLKYANEGLVLEILPILDNFERAIKLDDENLNDELSKFLEGFKMIYCHLKNSLEDYMVKAIDGHNKPFDPTYHQAVMTEHVDGMEPGMVIEVLQKGYLLNDKVIRPAMVRVSE